MRQLLLIEMDGVSKGYSFKVVLQYIIRMQCQKFLFNLFFLFNIFSITTCVYIFIQFLKLSPEESLQDPVYHVLLRHESKYVIRISGFQNYALMLEYYWNNAVRLQPKYDQEVIQVSILPLSVVQSLCLVCVCVAFVEAENHVHNHF